MRRYLAFIAVGTLPLLISCKSQKSSAPSGQETRQTAGTSNAREIDRDLNCGALLLVLSKGLESSGYPNKTEIAEMERMTVAYEKKAEALAGVSLQEKLVYAAVAEQVREKNMIQTDGFDAMLADLQKRKNACGYYAAQQAAQNSGPTTPPISAQQPQETEKRAAPAAAQGKLPSRSGLICYGDYDSLVSTLSDYCKEDTSCSGVRKPADNNTGLAYFLQAERDLGKSNYPVFPGGVVVSATGGPQWVIDVMKRRAISDLSSLSEVMASVCTKGDVDAKAVADLEFYSTTGQVIGQCDALVICK